MRLFCTSGMTDKRLDRNWVCKIKRIQLKIYGLTHKGEIEVHPWAENEEEPRNTFALRSAGCRAYDKPAGRPSDMFCGRFVSALCITVYRGFSSFFGLFVCSPCACRPDAQPLCRSRWLPAIVVTFDRHVLECRGWARRGAARVWRPRAGAGLEAPGGRRVGGGLAACLRGSAPHGCGSDVGIGDVWVAPLFSVG